jgi:ankyrin repeat protein
MSFLERLFGSSSKEKGAASDVDKLKTVFATGADVTAKSKEGRTALMEAALKGDANSVKAMITAGADVNAKTNKGRTALMYASSTTRSRKLGTLEFTLVLCAEEWPQRTECIKALLAAGADVNAKDNEGKTALREAAWKGGADSLKALIAAGADVNAKDKEGYTALDAALDLPDNVKALIAAGADVNAKDKTGGTVLFRAGNPDSIEALIAAGADVNAKNNKGRTALMYAISSRDIDCVKALIAGGADVDAKDNDGNTALYSAIASEDKVDALRKVTALIAAGADVNVKNNKGYSALMAAGVPKYAHLAAALKAAVTPELEAIESAKPARSAVRIFEKTHDGTFAETKGDLSAVPVLFAQAEPLYQKVMAAARSGRIMPDDESDLITCADFLSKVIELDTTRGVPFAMRGDMYFVHAQTNHDKSYLDKAEADYKKAIQVGSSDASNRSIWANNIERIHAIRSIS